jgi:hypothetical protein
MREQLKRNVIKSERTFVDLTLRAVIESSIRIIAMNFLSFSAVLFRVDAPPCSALEGWREEAQEEELHDAEEEQAQAQEGQVGRAEVLQGDANIFLSRLVLDSSHVCYSLLRNESKPFQLSLQVPKQSDTKLLMTT